MTLRFVSSSLTGLRTTCFFGFLAIFLCISSNQVLAREYGKYLKSKPQPGVSVTLEFDVNDLPDDIEAVAVKAASLRRNCFASVFEHFFNYQVANASNPNAEILNGVIHFRADETM